MKILKVDVSRDIVLKPIADRWYQVLGAFTIDFHLEGEGVVRYCIDDGFLFDGRSGPKIVDYYAPNLGTQDELKTYLIHDILSYDNYFSFEQNNALFYSNLRVKCGYSWSKAKLMWAFVSINDGYFGAPLPDSREYPNLSKIHVRHFNRLN